MPSGQSLAVEQLAQTFPGQAWVTQVAAVHGSDPDWMQNSKGLHSSPAQSESAAQDAPPGKPQIPPEHGPIAQSADTTHAAHTWFVQRPLPQETSSGHGSPTASLQSPAWHTPLKQPAPWVHACPKCPTVFASTHIAFTSQVVLSSQWLIRSSAPLGRSVQVPS